jgi:hypothetical protein
MFFDRIEGGGDDILLSSGCVDPFLRLFGGFEDDDLVLERVEEILGTAALF